MSALLGWPVEMRYAIHGLVLDSDIAISGYPEAGPGPVDLVVRHHGERPVPLEIEKEQVLQCYSGPRGPLYSTVRRPDGIVSLRLHGTAEFQIEPDHRVVRTWNDPRCGPELLGILVAGNLLATVLALRGETVLHASAVESGGLTLAFVADSGMGKSTMAALCCARGTSLVTDDLLRPYTGQDGQMWCYSGSDENRLRRDATDLLPAESRGTDTRRTEDGRFVWRPKAAACSPTLLTAIVLPVPDRASEKLGLELLPTPVALMELTRRPRLLGWTDSVGVSARFTNLAEVARLVPVFRAEVPWGPPFDVAILDDLLARTGLVQ